MPHKLTAGIIGLLLLATWPAGADEHATLNIGEGPAIIGSGHVVSQPRALSGFDAVQTLGSVDLDIEIGAQTAVTVDMDDNLQGQIRTQVQGTTLVIDSKGNWTSRHEPRVSITLPALSAVSVQGSGGTVLKGLKGGELALRIGGSGDIDAQGRVERLVVLIDGSGDARLGGLKADRVQARVNGSGDITVYAGRTLQATISGSGDIRYRGDAEVTSRVTGSGTVEKE
jgi:hypothetical protein